MADPPAATINTRAVFDAPTHMRLIAANDRVVFLRTNEDKDVHILRLDDVPTDEERQLAKLPSWIAPMRLCSFNNRTTLYFVYEEYLPGSSVPIPRLGKLTAADEYFREITDCRSYSIDFGLIDSTHGMIMNLAVQGDDATIITSLNDADGPKVWEFRLPGPNFPALNSICPELSGSLEQPAGITHRDEHTHSNGAILASTLFDHEKTAFRNEVCDLIANQSFTVPDELDSYKATAVAEDRVLYWKGEEGKASLSILRLRSIERVNLTVDMPLPANEVARIGLPCWTLDNRFFFLINSTLLMGQIPDSTSGGKMERAMQ